MPTFDSSPTLTALLNRLRTTYVNDAAFGDTDILAMLNDAYLDVCQSSRCCKTLTTITLVAGQSEYALPADFDEAICVVTGGRQLDPIPMDTALEAFPIDGFSFGYYLYGTIFGIVPEPIASSTPVYLLYSAQPAALTDYGQALDPRFPIEFADILLHWVLWRAQIMAGGAERIGSAVTNRQLYDLRLRELRRVCDSIPHTSSAFLQHVQQQTRKLVG